MSGYITKNWYIDALFSWRQNDKILLWQGNYQRQIKLNKTEINE